MNYLMNKYIKNKDNKDKKDIQMSDNSNSNSDSKDSEDYKQLRKYIIGADSDELSNKKVTKSSGVNNVVSLKKYNKIVTLCEQIQICVKNSQKKKTLQQFLDLCHKRKRSIIKKHIVDIAKYCTAQGYEQLAGTYIIESKNDKMIEQLRCVDKIIEYISVECHVDKNNNIISLLGVKQVTGKKKKTSKIILEEFSDNA